MWINYKAAPSTQEGRGSEKGFASQGKKPEKEGREGPVRVRAGGYRLGGW